MITSEEFDYRTAAAVLGASAPGILDEIRAILADPARELNFVLQGKQRNLSAQVQEWFAHRGWEKESPSLAIPDMRYDLVKGRIPMEIELGHQRLVFPDFFKFMANYSRGMIPAAVVVVTGEPTRFGHTWHCSMASTRRKIEAVSEVFLVPLLVVAVDP